MRTHNMRTEKFAATLLLTAVSFCAMAQKLPNVQAKSVWAPATVKLDGKADEWDAAFQAYNHATDIYYTIANDNDKLYLVVQATDQQVVNKIIGGGITLTIQKTGKKNDKDGISITYPVFDAKDRPYVRAGGGGVAGGRGMVRSFSVGGGGGGGGGASMDAIKVVQGDINNNTKVEGDSVMNVYNQKLIEKSKNIAVSGIPGLDSVISVYNENGIRTGQRFNNKMAYTYELSIDLKKLGLSAADAAKFAYHIKVNASTMGIIRMNINGVESSSADPAMQAKVQQLLSQMQNVSVGGGGETTDFWGEYTLAKN